MSSAGWRGYAPCNDQDKRRKNIYPREGRHQDAVHGAVVDGYGTKLEVINSLGKGSLAALGGRAIDDHRDSQGTPAALVGVLDGRGQEIIARCRGVQWNLTKHRAKCFVLCDEVVLGC